MCCLETLQSKHLNKIQRSPQKITSGVGVIVDFNFVIDPFMIFGKGLRRGAAGVGGDSKWTHVFDMVFPKQLPNVP